MDRVLSNYNDLKPSYLRCYILNTYDKNIRKEMLNNIEVKKIFLKDENHYEFVWLIQALKDYDLVTFLDDFVISEILSSKKAVDKVNSIMTVENEYKNIVLNKLEIIKFICKSDSLLYYLFETKKPFLETFFNFLLKENDASLYNILSNFNKDELYDILKGENLSKFVNNCKNYLKYIPIKTLNEILHNDYYISDFMKLDIYTIDDFIIRGLILDEKIYLNNEFQNKYLEIKNIERLRIMVEHLIDNNIYAYDILNKCIFKEYDDEIQNINENGIFKYLDNKNIDENMLIEKSEQLFLDMLIDKYFVDLKHNVLTNLKTIVDFNDCTNIIEKDRIDKYKQILNFKNLSLNDRKKLYFGLNEKYKMYLYDDFRKCQDKSYDMLNDSFIDLSKLNKTKKDNIDIYELKGEQFYIPIHTTHYIDGYETWTDREKTTLSLSVISDKFFGTYCSREDTNFVAFGFNKIKKEHIMHVFHSDSFSLHKKGTFYKNEIFTPKQLIENTKGYNEVLVMEENIKPDYIICFDDIKDSDIMIAEEMNIPIVIIHTEFYKEAIKNVSSIDLSSALNIESDLKYRRI